MIGALVPLTGPAAALGEYARNGMGLAVSEINAAGGVAGRPLRVIYEDSQSTTEGGVPAYQKLTRADHVPASLAILNAVVVPAASLANRESSVLINCGAQDARIRKEGGAFVFNVVPDAILEAQSMASFAFTELKITTAATLHLENDPGAAAGAAFANAFTALGGRIVADVEIDKNKDDTAAAIGRLKLASPPAVFVTAPARALVPVLQQAAALGLRPRWLTDASFELEGVIKTAGPAADGVIYTAQRPLDVSSPSSLQFLAAYRARFGFDPELAAATFYDGVYALKGAIDAAGGTTGGDIARGLRMLAREGVTGRIDFTQSAWLMRPLEFRTVRGGRVERVPQK